MQQDEGKGVKAYLANAAALLVAILVEREHALCTNQFHRLVSIREGVLNTNAVVLFHSVKQLICLLVQSACVQAAGHSPQMVSLHHHFTGCRHKSTQPLHSRTA